MDGFSLMKPAMAKVFKDFYNLTQRLQSMDCFMALVGLSSVLRYKKFVGCSLKLLLCYHLGMCYYNC